MFHLVQKKPPVVFYKKAVLKNFAIFLGKFQQGKNGLQHRCFRVNIARFLRTAILKNIFERSLLLVDLNIFRQKLSIFIMELQ